MKETQTIESSEGQVSSTSSDRSAVRQSTQKHQGLSLWFCGLIVLALFLGWFLPDFIAVFDTISNFHWQLICLMAMIAIFQIYRGRWLAFVLITLMLVWPVYRLSMLYQPPPKVEAVTPTIRMLTLNVFQGNLKYQQTFDLIEKTQPDIVGLVEFGWNWETGFLPLMKDYPYRVGPYHGNVIFSKFPIREDFNRKHAFDPWFSPGLGSSFWIEDQLVYFLLVHTTSPTSPERLMERDREIGGIRDAAYYRQRNMHVIVAGDFNATTHSRSLSTFLDNAELKDSRQGFGLQNSWPTWFWPASICIDHVVVSKKVKVVNRTTGSHVGSDHLPVITDIAFGKHRRVRKRPENQ